VYLNFHLDFSGVVIVEVIIATVIEASNIAVVLGE
jgi:hypothetical protein